MRRTPGLPYGELNLRVNPFGALDRSERAEVAAADVEPWVEILAAAGPEREAAPRNDRPGTRDAAAGGAGRVALQLVGPPGCGKSTLLAALRARFPGAPLLAWSGAEGWRDATAPAIGDPPRNPRPRPGPGGRRGAPLFLDDAHLLRVRLCRRVLRWGRLALASHWSLAGRLERAGFTVRTVDVPSLHDWERLGRIVARRLEWARRGPGPLPRIEPATLRELHDRHGADLRTVMGELYDLIQDRSTNGRAPWATR